MFFLAYTLGLYSICIYFLGLTGLLYPQVISYFTIIYFLLAGIFTERRYYIFEKIKNYKFNYSRSSFVVGLLALLAVVNLMGALGPELAFDALWYHLTIPKLYLLQHRITFIPGGLFYYSAMPKLGEMFYLSSLALGSEIIAKLVHFLFGILTTIAIYMISKKYYSKEVSILTALLFYGNLVVAWLSITAYIDLTRTFFEVMAFWAFLNWYQKREKKWLINSSLLLGLAISTKILALGSLFIILILVGYVYFSEKRKTRNNIFLCLLLLILGAIFIPLPWLLFSYSSSGSFIYPFFSNIYPVTTTAQLFNPLNFLKEVFNIFTHAADPISPVYLSVFPAVILLFKKFTKVGRLILLYSVSAIIIWYLTPRTGGGRFILAYLPVLSLLVAEILDLLQKQNSHLLYKYIIILILVTTAITIGVRAHENVKYLPVIFGFKTKDKFLTQNLNFAFGDFYDTDGYFKRHITQNDRVLLIGFHNLFYIDFPFIDNSYLQTGDSFNFIATQNAPLPKEYNNWRQVYENRLTGVKLYERKRFVALR